MNRWLRRIALSWLPLLAAMALLIVLATTETGLRGLVRLSNHLLTGLITIGSASGTLMGPMQFHNVRYDDGIDTVLIESMNVSWSPGHLRHRQIRVHAVRGAGVQVYLGESQGETALIPFSLPAHLAIDTISAEEITIFSDQKAMWRITTGQLTNLSYQGNTLGFDDLVLKSRESVLRAKGQLQTDNEYPLHWTLEAQVQPNGYQPIAARGTLTGPLNRLILDAQLSSPFPSQLNGRLDNLLGAKTTWEARLKTPAAALPDIHRQWPDQRFSDVSIDGRGTLDAYSLSMHAKTMWAASRESVTVDVAIEGDLDQLRIHALHLAQSRESLTLQGRLGWHPHLAWHATMEGAHLDPSRVWENWPGDVSFQLATEGERHGTDVKATFLLPKLQGTLRQFPLTGKGEAHVDGNQVHIPDVLLASAHSTLRLQGKIENTVDLSVELHSGNLREIWPQARGSVDLRGRLSGQQDKPELSLQLAGARIGFENTSIDKLSAQASGSLAKDGSLKGSLKAEGGRFGSTSLDRLLVQLNGPLSDHSLTVEGRNTDITAAMTVQGQLIAAAWQGTIRQLSFADRHFGSWQMRQPAALSVSSAQCELKPVCLNGPRSARLCAAGSWKAEAPWHIHGELAAFALDSLNTPLNLPWPVEGQLNAILDLHGLHAGITTGSLHADSAGMTMRLPVDQGYGIQRLQWTKNALRVDYATGELHLVVDNELADGSHLRADFTQVNPNPLASSLMSNPIKGKVQLQIKELSPVALLTDQAIVLSGTLKGGFDITGTPTAPLFAGRLDLAHGQAAIPPLGITLAPLVVTAQGDAAAMRLQASANSGSGTIEVTCALRLQAPDANLAVIHLKGERFKAARLPEIDLDISPDLQVTVNRQQMDIRGEVYIPKAKITTIDFAQAIAASNDVVIIDEEAPRTAWTDLPLSMTVKVIAGDDVRLDAFGLRGVITGDVQVTSQPGRPQIGNGTLMVHQGSFTVYGRRLKIDSGRLLFSGGPLTNPGIELRSENKTDKATTGIRVEGFLQKPEISFYSSPAMEQAAIVAHLLETTAIGGETREDLGFLGKAASTVGLGGLVPYFQSLKTISMIDEIKLETGTSYDELSLVFGSWLTPDFYVSYGKDLVKESGFFQTRFNLGNGFSFQTETGASQSGGDIKYEFEY